MSRPNFPNFIGLDSFLNFKNVHFDVPSDDEQKFIFFLSRFFCLMHSWRCRITKNLIPLSTENFQVANELYCNLDLERHQPNNGIFEGMIYSH